MPPRLELVPSPESADYTQRIEAIELAWTIVANGQALAPRDLGYGWTVATLLPEDHGIRLGVVFERKNFEHGDRVEIERVSHGFKAVTVMTRPTHAGGEKRTYTTEITDIAEAHTGSFEEWDTGRANIPVSSNSCPLAGRSLDEVRSELEHLELLLAESQIPENPGPRRTSLWSRVFWRAARASRASQ